MTTLDSDISRSETSICLGVERLHSGEEILTSQKMKQNNKVELKTSTKSAFRKVSHSVSKMISEDRPQNLFDDRRSATAKQGSTHAHSFSVSRLLSDETKTEPQNVEHSSLPLDMTKRKRESEMSHPMSRIPSMPMTSYPDPRIAFTKYWLDHLKAVQNSPLPPYMPMFPPFMFNATQMNMDPLRPYLTVPRYISPSLLHHVTATPPHHSTSPEFPKRMRSEKGSSATDTNSDNSERSHEEKNLNEESFGFSRQESGDREISDSDRESDNEKRQPMQSSPVENRHISSPTEANTSRRPSLSPIHVSPTLQDHRSLSFMATDRVESHISCARSSHSSVPPTMMRFPYATRRPHDPTKPPALKKYKCDLCGKAFSRSNTLVTHRRIHTGEKPFECEICSRAFRQPGNLTRHRLTHTSSKPYVCPVCRKAFNRASNLQTHMRTHATFTGFRCHLCGKGFQQNMELKMHLYTHMTDHGCPQ